jgi:hypothetical protein
MAGTLQRGGRRIAHADYTRGALIGLTSSLAVVTALLASSPAVGPGGREGSSHPLRAWTGEALFPGTTVVVLNGTVEAGNQPAYYKFQYGMRLPYSNTTAVGEEVVAAHRTDTVSEAASHLKAGTTYHYRVIAFNKYGFVTGKDRTFKTRKAS